MSSEPEMSDAQFTNVFSIMIGGLILLTIALIILAVVISSGVKQSDLNELARNSGVAERIQPAGQINVGQVASTQAGSGSGGGGASESASGESVYQNNCAACHANGVAGAPTFGDKDAWSDRIAKGEETLYKHAIEGFQGDAGMMPAKGGNTSLSDEAVKAAVDHMLAAVSDSGGSGSAESGSAGSGSGEAASGGAASGGSASSAADTGGSAGSDSAAAGSAASEASGAGDVPSGESVYQSSCVACHASGVAGAPKLDDSAAWTDRIAKGKETLYKHAIEGFQGDTGMMPAKGGNTSLSDEAVKAAVDYMVQQAK